MILGSSSSDFFPPRGGGGGFLLTILVDVPFFNDYSLDFVYFIFSPTEGQRGGDVDDIKGLFPDFSIIFLCHH